jgi:hypothetical protein
MSKTMKMDVTREFKDPDSDLPSHVYATVNLVQHGNVDPSAYFSQARTTPILDDPSKYVMSVVRFEITTADIPLMIVPAELGQANQGRTTFKVSLGDRASGLFVTNPIIWAPEDSTFITPAPPLTRQQTDSRWYWLHSYTYFVRLVNAVLAQTMTELIALVPGLVGTPPPFLEYNPATTTFSLFAPKTAFDVTQVGGAAVTCEFNESLWMLFQHIPYSQVTNVGNRMYRFMPAPTPSLSNVVSLTLPPAAATDYIKMTQEFPDLGNWNSFSTLTLTTSGIPVNHENISPIELFAGDTQKGAGIPGGQAQLPILTDFIPECPVGYEGRQSSVYYVPSGEYRLVTMYGSKPLSQLDFRVFWTDPFAQQHQLMMKQGSHINLKIMWRLKSWLA